MTKEEILKMEAGSKLSAVVSEVIFGVRGFWHYSFGFLPKSIPYSTDISAAWPIVVRMGLALFPLNNKEWACCKASHIYRVEIGQLHYADPNLVICKEAPEAICKAALIAKLSEKGGRLTTGEKGG